MAFVLFNVFIFINRSKKYKNVLDNKNLRHLSWFILQYNALGCAAVYILYTELLSVLCIIYLFHYLYKLLKLRKLFIYSSSVLGVTNYKVTVI